MKVQTKTEARGWNKGARIENWRRENQKGFVIEYMWEGSVRVTHTPFPHIKDDYQVTGQMVVQTGDNVSLYCNFK